MSNKSIKKNVIVNGIRVLMQILFPLISFPYASRILLADGIGKVNFASSIIAYFVLFASLGISSYGTRNGAKVRDDKDKLSIFTQELFFINMVTTIITYIIFVLCLYFVPKFVSYRNILLITSLSIICTPIGIDWLYGAIEDFGYITKRSIIFQFISLILLFVFVKDSGDIIEYTCVTIFSTVGSNILNIIHSRHFVNWKLYKLSDYNFIKHLKPILIIFGVNLACNIYMNLDKTMLGVLVNDYEVGLYTAAYKVNNIVLSFVNSVGAVLLPRMSYFISEQKIKEYHDLFYKSFNIVLMLAIPATIGLYMLSSELIFLLSGEQYFGAIPAMQILSLLILISGMGTTFSVQLFVPNDQEKVCLIASTCAAITNFISNLYFIPIFGAKGAAIGTIICEIVALIICLINAKKNINLKTLYKYTYHYLLGGIVVTLIVLGIKSIITNVYLILLLSVVLAATSYFIVLLLLKNKYFMDFFIQFKNTIKLKLLKKYKEE